MSDSEFAMTFRPYQVDAAIRLSEILSERRFALDGSDTGIGKTFTALATAREFSDANDNFPPVAIVCRARAITKWTEACALCGITPTFIMSWEKSRGKNKFFIPIKNKRGKTTAFNLRLPEETLVIIDEIHAGGAIKSLNSEIVIAARRCANALTLGLSATPGDSPLKMRALGFCVGMHTLDNSFWNWCRRNGCCRAPFGGLYFRKRDRDRVLSQFHNHIFGSSLPWGIRLHKKDLMEAGMFPECETSVELWDIPTTPPAWLEPFMDEVEADREADMERHDWNPSSGILAMRDRQRSELTKVPLLMEEIEERLEEGESVVVFVQFTRTIRAITSRLGSIEYGVIDGKVPRRDQERAANDLRDDKIRVVICQIDAGSESIDLHDITGKHPRHVIIFPTYKAVTLIQALGRTVRSGASKNPVVQRIIYSSETIEKKIARAVNLRLDNLSMLRDGELTGETI
jgi:superfamily II DNA or RNA helicase